MKKEEVIAQVQKKLKESSLSGLVLNEVASLAIKIKKGDSDDTLSLLDSFVAKYKLDDEEYAKVVEKLLVKYQVTSLGEDLEKKKEVLKQLIKNSPLKAYLSGLNF